MPIFFLWKFSDLNFDSIEKRELIGDFLHVMYITGADFTNSFRNLNKLEFSLDSMDVTDEEINKFVETYLGFCCEISELRDASKPRFPKE
jgi:hypothetical protein